MADENSKIRDIIIRDIIIALLVAILAGVVVAIIVGEGRFAPKSPSGETTLPPTQIPVSQPLVENSPTPTQSISSVSSVSWIVFEKWLPDSNGYWGETVELWAIQSDGTDLKKLTQGYYDTDASWSPDGKYLAFSRGTGYRIMILDLSGNMQTIDLGWFSPNWIDNENLIFSDKANENWVLRQSTIQGQDKGIINIPIPDPFSPQISPNRQFVAINGDDGLYLITWATKDVAKLLDGKSNFPLAWEPDNKHVIFVDDNGDCHTIDIQTLQKTPLQGIQECNISYSIDGSQAAYQFDDAIWIMNADGTNKRLLVQPNDISIYRNPVWSP